MTEFRPERRIPIPPIYLRRMEMLGAIADVTRATITYLLGTKGPLSAGEIAGYFDMSKAAVSHHLKVLLSAGLITRERKGQRIIYSFDYRVLADAFGGMISALEEWDPSVEESPPTAADDTSRMMEG